MSRRTQALGERRSPRRWFAGLAAAVLAAVFLLPAALEPAKAQAPGCAKRSDLLPHLEQSFGEQPVAQGLGLNGALYEILASEGGGTWTLILSLPNGMSCLVATGEGWRFVFSKPKEKGT